MAVPVDVAEDTERVRPGGGREEDRLVPARLAEAGLERKVARLLAEGDRRLERRFQTLDRLPAWLTLSSSPLFWPV